MTRLLSITTRPELTEALDAMFADAEASSEGSVVRVDDWPAGRDALIEGNFDLALVDYNAVRIEGHDAFIQLDNMLGKAGAGGVIAVSKPSPRVDEFVDNLPNLRQSMTLGESSDEIRTALAEVLADLVDEQARDQVSDGSPTVLESTLPELTSGTFDDVSFLRVLHTISVEEATGVLTASTGEMSRRIPVEAGALVGSEDSAFARLKSIPPIVAWDEGTWSFQQTDTPAGETIALWDHLLPALYQHLSQQEAMQRVLPKLSRYAVATREGEEVAESRGDEAMAAFLNQADGERTLEQILSSLGGSNPRAFQAAYIGLEIDAALTTDEPTSPPVVASYRHVEVDSEPEDREPSESAEDRDTDPLEAPTIGRADSTFDRSVPETEQELRETVDAFQRATPYEIFDLWEGCGHEAVRRRFYKLVKQHHPDSYGGNISSEAKSLAQKVFIEIKKAKTLLDEQEDEQTVPPPEERDGAKTSAEADETVRVDTSPGGDEQGHPGEHPDEDAYRERRERIDRLRRKTQTATPAPSSRGNSTIDDLKNRSSMGGGASSGASGLGLTESSVTGSKEASELDPPESDDEAKEYFNQGYRAFKQNNEEKALHYFRLAHDYDPDSGRYKTFYAYLLFLNEPDRRDEARQMLESAIRLEDRQTLPDAHLFLGRILRVKGLPKRAKKHFQRALDLNPASVEAKRELRLFEMRGEGGSKSQMGDTSSMGSDEEDPSFRDDPTGYLKKLLNKDLF
jgi:TPR repeat protein